MSSSRRSRMKRDLVLFLCGFSLLNGCTGNTKPDAPQVSLSTRSLSFGNQILGETSQPLAITLANEGSDTLHIKRISTTAGFAEANTCSSTLPPRANCKIDVTFSPTGLGNLAGTLWISDNAAGHPHQVMLTGTGIPGQCRAYGGSCSMAQQCCSGRCVESRCN